MRNREQLRVHLIRCAIAVVARDGLEKTKVSSLAQWAQVSQSSLYRCFKNKDDLLCAALLQEDKGFIELVLALAPVLDDETLPWRERCWRLWKPVWDFIIDPPEDCIFYVRYYYSENFRRDAKEEHDRRFTPVRERLSPYFLPGRRDSVLLHQIFETMLSFAYRVMTGQMENDEETCRMAFEQICNFLRPHFRYGDAGVCL